MAATINLKSACAVQSTSAVLEDVKRAREFYRYLQPANLLQPTLRRRSSTFGISNDHIPSLSNALSPFCQLVTMRCNAAKAMLNVMDRDVMYFLAEASMKRSSTGNGEETYEFCEDPIMMACSTVPLKGRICELTLRMDMPNSPDQVPTFVIPDLSESPFAAMAIIAGPPYYRFYAGVPITTRDGVNIGSLAIMDTVARPDGLSQTEEEFLGKTADQVMAYLETNRQAIEGMRSRKMAQGLEAFIAGKKCVDNDNDNANGISDKTLRKRARAAYGIALESDNDSIRGDDRLPTNQPTGRTGARPESTISLESEPSSSGKSTPSQEQITQDSEDDSRSHAKTFARAANLLRESLGDLGDEGSVHFLSLNTRVTGTGQATKTFNGSGPDLPEVMPLTNGVPGKAEEVTRGSTYSRPIASSSVKAPLATSSSDSSQQSLLGDDMLREFMRRYPGGRLWTLDEANSGSSSDDEARPQANGGTSRPQGGIRRKSRRKQTELLALRTAFPSARQVLFTPVWDATVGSFAYGCFIVSALETRSFNPSTELPFLNSFCSTVMAECSRFDTIVADRQKSDFVGTISHEMRSPLHGVLASVEFLAETDVTSFQKQLIETIDSCGRTLLDTINHVLDFSKVNSFQKHWQAANHKGLHAGKRTNFLGPENSSRAVSVGAPPLLQLFAITDVTSILEEVVDGLILGNTYNADIDITDTSREARGRTSGKSSVNVSKTEEVSVILDVQQADWVFLTQPGAVRRIIMNITGNALKYTSRGTILVRLEQRDSYNDNESNSRVMVLTITDTGKGISSDFLASRLFVPFAQENALAPGTGLGMSIVRSIVLMLGGTIDVTSRIGQGTTVQVTLPLRRPLPGQVSSQSTPRSGGTAQSGTSTGDDSIQLLQNQGTGETVAFYRPNPAEYNFLTPALLHYVHEWYGLEFVEQDILENASVILVQEEDLAQLMTTAMGIQTKRPALVVMCRVSSRHSTSFITSLEQRISGPVEFVARPCGPNKLARSIRHALEKKRAIKPRFSQVANLGVIPEAVTPSANPIQSTACDPAGTHLQELDLSGPGEFGHVVQASETFAASHFSQNAQMAIHDPGTATMTPRTQMGDHDAFPFPVQSEEKSRQSREIPRNRGLSFSKQVDNGTPMSNGTTKTEGTPAREQGAMPVPFKVDPRVLLVDDNKINLKLLETFLEKKRKYTCVHQAEDGQQAVDAVMTEKEPFDIIFMDISMPVMNGFEATRAIREYEAQNRVQTGAMIIALTGLASGRDQSEGFNSGCDIYMTKPVSFKEVGKLLDNWEGHQRANIDQDPNGDMAKLSLRLKSELGIPAQVSNGHTE